MLQSHARQNITRRMGLDLNILRRKLHIMMNFCMYCNRESLDRIDCKILKTFQPKGTSLQIHWVDMSLIEAAEEWAPMFFFFQISSTLCHYWGQPHPFIVLGSV